jgi:hypothetical protein
VVWGDFGWESRKTESQVINSLPIRSSGIKFGLEEYSLNIDIEQCVLRFLPLCIWSMQSEYFSSIKGMVTELCAQ